METFEYIDNYKELPNASSIHCDTRDFNIMCHDADRAYRRRTLKEIHRKNGYGTLSDCRFTKDEILSLLKDLETRSGGKGDWRMITTEHYKEWLKYIRFIKDGDTYIAYDNDYNVLSRTIITEPINKEHLAFNKNKLIMSETIMSETTIAPNKNKGENNTTKINLCEILKGHEGETFYNSIVGDTILEKICINQAGDYCIVTNYMILSKEGKLCDKGEMVIFPSKDQRDWNKWIEEQKHKVPKTWSDLVKANKVSSTTVQTSCDEKGDCSDTLSDSPIEKSALALLKINQLIEAGYGGNVSKYVWENINLIKYCICINANGNFDIRTTREPIWFSHIAFHTKEQAEEFLIYSENVQLLKDYFMI